jgi:hypothetical protein
MWGHPSGFEEQQTPAASGKPVGPTTEYSFNQESIAKTSQSAKIFTENTYPAG